MNSTAINKGFEPGRMGIVMIFFTVFIALSGLFFTGLILVKNRQVRASTANSSHYQMKSPTSRALTTSASEVLNNSRPSLLLFYPVEVCRRRYCLTPEIVTARLQAHALDAVNVVSVPVYAVSMNEDQTRPYMPIVDWDVYAVEPYSAWLPEFSETVYGWGLEAPVVTLVAKDGTVLYRGDEYFNPADLEQDGWQIALEN
jgi:hypothetical protein